MLTISYLLEQPEQEFLDFKRDYHDNNALLVLDIICLANAKTPNDRFLIFGIEDKTHGVIGIENDTNRKNKQNIIDCLQGSKLNSIPIITMTTEILNGHEVDILCIHNTKNRPYFLLEDKISLGKTVRAGVIYTRNGDTNTPINSTSSMSQQQEIWREYFGLSLSPRERFDLYLKDLEGWTKESNNDDSWSYYYKAFPEFRLDIISKDIRGKTEFSEIQDCCQYDIFLTYFSTKLDYSLFFFGDGARYFLPWPDTSAIYYDDVLGIMANDVNFEGEFFYIISNSLEYKLYQLTQELMRTNVSRTIEDWNRYAIGAKPFLILDSIEDVKEKISKDCSHLIKSTHQF